jgi:hypothetical protein
MSGPYGKSLGNLFSGSRNVSLRKHASETGGRSFVVSMIAAVQRPGASRSPRLFAWEYGKPRIVVAITGTRGQAGGGDDELCCSTHSMRPPSGLARSTPAWKSSAGGPSMVIFAAPASSTRYLSVPVPLEGRPVGSLFGNVLANHRVGVVDQDRDVIRLPMIYVLAQACRLVTSNTPSGH